MGAQPGDAELDSRSMLLRRYRCVAFAALCEGVSEAELLDGLRVAVLAASSAVDQPATPPRPDLRLVT